MTRRRPFVKDISVSAAKRNGARAKGMTGAMEGSQRSCEWPGCDQPGKYRAPKDRDRLDEFRWFCLDHVREYNSRWNYYENMTDEEISASMRSDELWGRPTWKLGKAPADVRAGPHQDGESWRRFGFDDPLEILGDKATLNPGDRRSSIEARKRLLPKPVRRALEIMELDAAATRQAIRLKYKELVKRYHPDQNGGDRSDESRLREVLWAWDQLKASEAFKD